jgi:aryl-alcohol dehydrogenase-like predicted oxidoreductase
MQYTNLGRTGLKVSRLCLGTMNYGPHAPESEGHAQMDKALELGFNFFDTADVYGWKTGEGITEQIIGFWFAQGGGRREKVILATKVYGDMASDPNDLTMKGGLSALKIRRACENSLKRLKTDYIDLYQMHHISRSTPWDELYQAFEVLVQQGKILYVGSSNFAGWHIADAMHQAKQRNFLGLVCEQSQYSLLCRLPELEVLPSAKQFGLGVIPWSPLAGGMLGGVLQKQKSGVARRGGEEAEKRIEKLRPQLKQWESFCNELGEKPADVALAWTLHNPAVTAPIIGPRTMEQLTTSVKALEIKLDDTALKSLDRIFPGPKGSTDEGTSDWTKQEAPEAYSW